ncbi:MAG: hypothetical protein K2G03_00535, partial [Bacilli bacterium]|nr:hypothetical protein [Bacilli bacterium]
LNVSIREIKLLDEGSLTLEHVLYDRIKQIMEEEKKYQKVKQMCKEIIDSKKNYESIDITNYFQSMNALNKEGFTMRDIKSNKAKKIIGAILSSVFFSLFFVFIEYMFIYIQTTETTKMPWFIFIFVVSLFAIPIIGILGNLIARIKEINGGEEDEASKY